MHAGFHICALPSIISYVLKCTVICPKSPCVEERQYAYVGDKGIRQRLVRYEFLPVTTHFWKPNEDYVSKMIVALKGIVLEGDIVVISEKAISTATSNIVDENGVKPSLTAHVMAKYWMRYFWAYFLGPICHLEKRTLSHFKKYPLKEGSVHKQVALQHAGFLQALEQGSEGGIDGSNLPYSYVSLPLDDATRNAELIQAKIRVELGKNVAVMIVDTDKTYSWRNFHFTSRPKPIVGIHSVGGFAAYVVGRVLKLNKRATPLAVVGVNLNVEEALNIAESVDKTRGFGAGKTIWDMAQAFNVSLTGISWRILEAIEHKPIVLARPLRSMKHVMSSHDGFGQSSPTNSKRHGKAQIDRRIK